MFARQSATLTAKSLETTGIMRYIRCSVVNAELGIYTSNYWVMNKPVSSGMGILSSNNESQQYKEFQLPDYKPPVTRQMSQTMTGHLAMHTN